MPVHICTPNSLRTWKLQKAALEAGKHVVSEKPLATSLQDARVLADLAEEQKGLVGTVPFINRYHPMVREARSRVQSDEDRQAVSDSRLVLAGLAHAGGRYQLARRCDRRRKVTRLRRYRPSIFCDVIEWITGERFTSLIATLGTPVAQRSAAASRVAFKPAAK